jgi:hypothetical protein
LATKIREDIWTEEQDAVLISTVLDYISNGRTQLAAFDEVADMLDRTANAVSFRFNNALRSKCRNDLFKAKQLGREAKKERKVKPVSPVVEVTKEQPEVELRIEPKATIKIPVKPVSDLIPKEDFPTSDLSIYDSVGDILKKFGMMDKEIKVLKKENKELKARLGE